MSSGAIDMRVRMVVAQHMHHGSYKHKGSRYNLQ